jgi:hypothetical protein
MVGQKRAEDDVLSQEANLVCCAELGVALNTRHGHSGASPQKAYIANSRLWRRARYENCLLLAHNGDPPV